MNQGTPVFSNNSERLHALLAMLNSSALQLPDFQRSWIWRDNNIRNILRSILNDYPIGSLTFVKRNNKIDMQFRSIEGVPESDNAVPDVLLLDGQQRMTALYLCLMSSEPVETSSGRSRTKRHYFVDMQVAVGGDLDDPNLIRASSDKGELETTDGFSDQSDFTIRDNQIKGHLFPTHLLLEPEPWLNEYESYWEDTSGHPSDYNVFKFVSVFRSRVLASLVRYELPITTVEAHVSHDSICQIFEHVNMGATALTVFELLTAKLAPSSIRLGKEWRKCRSRLQEHPVLGNLKDLQFLQVISLLATNSRSEYDPADSRARGRRGRPGCEGPDVLSLTAEEYRRWAGVAERGLTKSAEFMSRLCVFSERDLTSLSQIVSLAATFGSLNNKRLNSQELERLERWYWCGVFSEAYSGSTSTQNSRDILELPRFVENGEPTALVRDATFSIDRLLALKSRRTAVVKGLFALQLRGGLIDWSSLDKIDIKKCLNEKVDIHHIFPRSWCNSAGIGEVLSDCVINKTPLSGSTNQFISGRAPSKYLKKLASEDPSGRYLEAINASSVDVSHLASDDFKKFWVDRGMRLMAIVAAAIGKELDSGRVALELALVQGGTSDNANVSSS